MKKTITLLSLSAMLFALSFPTEAQQPKKVYRIGYLQTSSREQLLHLYQGVQGGNARPRLRRGSGHHVRAPFCGRKAGTTSGPGRRVGAGSTWT